MNEIQYVKDAMNSDYWGKSPTEKDLNGVK